VTPWQVQIRAPLRWFDQRVPKEGSRQEQYAEVESLRPLLPTWPQCGTTIKSSFIASLRLVLRIALPSRPLVLQPWLSIKVLGFG
jgi:hypothetical protein